MHHQAVTPTDPRKSYSVKSKSINKSRIPLNYNSRPPSLTSSTTSLASNSTSPTPRSVTDTILANSIPFPSVIHHDTAISHSNNSALDPGWLLAHSKDEMAELLNKADRLIKSNQTDLEIAASFGKALLEENIILRNRRDTLLSNRSPTDSRRSEINRSSTSTLSVPTSDSNHRGTASPRDWRTSLSQSKPILVNEECASPCRSSVDNRSTRSRSSISSLFAPAHSSPTNLYNTASTAELDSLNNANYNLTLQLMDLQTDAEEAEREGKKKLRKLEKELKELRGELDRSQGRGGEPELYRSLPAENRYHRETSNDEDDGRTPTFVHKTLSTSTPSIGRPTVSFEHSPDAYTDMKSSSLPVNRRAPGEVGLTPPCTLDPISLPNVRLDPVSTSVSEKHPTLVAQLLAKISELESTNETISEDRIIMEERLERAHLEVGNLRKKCEELEDELIFDDGRAAVEWNERSTIQWADVDDLVEGSKDRRSSATSTRSKDARHHKSTTSTTSKGKGALRRDVRTLGSELGSDWGDDESVHSTEYDEFAIRHNYDEGDELSEEEEAHLRRSRMLSRRTLALSELGLPASFNSSYSNPSHLRYDSDHESISSDFSYIARNDRERSDYYPETMLARYHPRMVVMRLQDKALQQIAELVVYLRFFLLLGLAIIWALWQGPRKTLRMIDGVKNPRDRSRDA